MSAHGQEASELFAVFYPRLAGWTARLVDPETAHDVATEAFVRLLSRWSSVREPRAWLYMTAANLVRDHWRRAERERTALSRLRPGASPVEGPDVATATTVRRLVQDLPDRLRVPVLLYYYADLPVGQIALATGRAEGTIKRALFDARALLAQGLEENA